MTAPRPHPGPPAGQEDLAFDLDLDLGLGLGPVAAPDDGAASPDASPATGLDPAAWLTAAASDALPVPTREDRWQPLRVGVVNLWEYEDEEFWFADGRLVLRGGNGAGKTKVLELTTLMLMRGEIAPPVLDPFGSRNRTMQFNLLPSGEGDDPRPAADSGLGYAWVEFGLLDAGTPRYLTAGLGASARRGTGSSPVSVWRFVTPRRVRGDLVLVRERQPLPERDLRELDGVSVFSAAGAYRERISRELFGLEPDAYDNLTTLLRELRRPKLGERLNPAELATTLRQALPPLAAHEVTALADGWERLEDLRAQMSATEGAARAVASFVSGAWRPWARAVVQRRAAELVGATTTLDNTTRARRAAEDTLESVRARQAATEAEHVAAQAELRTQRAAERQILESQAFRDAQQAQGEVARLTEQVAGTNRQREGAADRLAAAEARARASAERAAAATAAFDGAQAARFAAQDRARDLAAPAGLAASARAGLPPTDGDGQALRPDLDVLGADHQRREQRLTHLRGLGRTYREAERSAERSGQTVGTREEDLRRSEGAAAAAEDALHARVAEAGAALRTWAGALEELTVPPGDLGTWLDHLAHDHHLGAAREAAGAGVAEARAALGEERQRLAGEAAPLRARRSEAAAELARVRTATEAPPPGPLTWARRERPEPSPTTGAPFWRCVEPREADHPALGAVESALAAAGLLDAWLTPDGRLTGVPGEAEAFAFARRAVAGPSLADVLVADDDGPVEAAAVTALLRSIAWAPVRPALEPSASEPGGIDTGHAPDDGRAWLSPTGEWAMGHLAGRARPVETVSYLGASAREAARRRRIAALEAELADLDARLRVLAEAGAVVAGREARLREEERAFPDDGAVRGAVVVLTEAMRALEAAAERLAEARRRFTADEVAAGEARAALASYAAEHGFRPERIEEDAEHLRTYATALRELAHLLRREDDLAGARDEAGAAAQEGAAHAEESRAALAALVAEHDDLLTRLRTAQRMLSKDHREVLQMLRRTREAIVELEGSVETLAGELLRANAKAEQAQAVLERHEEARQEAERRRDVAMAAWWAAADAGVLAGAEVEEPERRTVESARTSARAARREGGAPDDARLAAAQDRAWRAVYGAQQRLHVDLEPTRDARILEPETDAESGSDGGVPQPGAAGGVGLAEPLPRFEVLVDGTTGWLRPDVAADRLAEQVRAQAEHFDTEQQKVLATLLGSAFIEHLKERLDYTERTVAAINRTLAAHPTRQGQTVRLTVSPDPLDPDAGQVVRALEKGYDQLTSERQKTVRDFLARRVDEARDNALAEGVDWRVGLGRALDYRTWLRITLEYRAGGSSRWQAFDSAAHGAKSGGEKVVLLSQPLFAAAVVAYGSARPTAPRWVWLDEAMTGVDPQVKASFMGLTVEFDLDIMLTAHDEWATYASVPAVAIYDLARHRHLAGVDVVPYLWAAGQRTRVGA